MKLTDSDFNSLRSTLLRAGYGQSTTENILGITTIGNSVLIRAKEAEEKAFNAASQLGVPRNIVQNAFTYECSRRRITPENGSAKEVWDWAGIQLLSGKLK